MPTVEGSSGNESQPAPAAPSAPDPYQGPIVQSQLRTEVTAGAEVKISGSRLNTVTKVTAEGEELEILQQSSTELLLGVPETVSGEVDLVLSWQKIGPTGDYLIPDALVVSPATEISQIETVEKKVNAGSFKGYVAVYARGYEGKRLSAKIGNDWVIVDPIENNQEDGTLFRVTDFTGAGVDIAVRIYIDRELVDTINLTTK